MKPTSQSFVRRGGISICLNGSNHYEKSRWAVYRKSRVQGRKSLLQHAN